MNFLVRRFYLILVVLLLSGLDSVSADDKKGKTDLLPKDNSTRLEKNLESAGKANTERQRENERQKNDPHAGRVKTGEGTSVGGTVNPPSVNIKKEIP